MLEKEGDVNTFFSTGINSGNGEIIITEFDDVNHTITGEFKFTAINIAVDPLAKKSVNFQNGIFYKLPLKVASKEIIF